MQLNVNAQLLNCECWKSQALNAVNATKKGSEHEETEEQHSELDKFTICIALL